MTEDSFYWSGTTADSPGDAGVYAESTMWRNLAQIAIAGNAESDSDLYNVGVFYSVGNQLEVTLDGVNLDVDTGAGLVDGTYYENDASVDITVDAAAAGDERIDYIVLRKCYEGSTYNPGGNVPAVDEQEVRITVIKGTEVTPPAVPSAPSLTHDTGRTTYWDVPLAQVDVDDTGATAVTDAREYVDAETKTLWIDCELGYNITDGTAIQITARTAGGVQSHEFIMPDNKSCYAHGYSVIPSDYIKDGESVGVFWSDSGGGNMYVANQIAAAGCSETFNTHVSSNAYAAEAIYNVDNAYSCHSELSASASAAPGDIIKLTIYRDATDPLDTINDSVDFIGFKFSYFGWKW